MVYFQLLRGLLYCCHFVNIPLLTYLFQLRKIVRAVRSSPQRRQAWFREIKLSAEAIDNALYQSALMLILDVKTRWSSTHQMLRASPSFPIFSELT
jgi:hypothetical protein